MMIEHKSFHRYAMVIAAGAFHGWMFRLVL